MSAQGYNVYKVQYRLGMQDPLIPGVRYHTVIFVQTESNWGGYIHHVIGDISSRGGMTYESKSGRSPDASETFHAKHYLGQIRSTDYPTAVETILRAIPPSEDIQSENYGNWTMQTRR